MLQREPDKRATLSSIHSHPWLNDGDLTRVTSVLPLITRETVADDDQTYFVQKMVEGKIATREEILQYAILLSLSPVIVSRYYCCCCRLCLVLFV